LRRIFWAHWKSGNSGRWQFIRFSWNPPIPLLLPRIWQCPLTLVLALLQGRTASVGGGGERERETDWKRASDCISERERVCCSVWCRMCCSVLSSVLQRVSLFAEGSCVLTVLQVHERQCVHRRERERERDQAKEREYTREHAMERDWKKESVCVRAREREKQTAHVRARRCARCRLGKEEVWGGKVRYTYPLTTGIIFSNTSKNIKSWWHGFRWRMQTALRRVDTLYVYTCTNTGRYRVAKTHRMP